ncbi:MAG: GTP-binding protein [Promethearchaeota archaeon]|nr:MAG: GTP-binding protein [Candidatus Lokiarchaeota archaeon]
MTNTEIENLHFKIKQDAMRKIGKTIGYYDYFKYRVSYDMELDLDLIFIFVAGLMDDFFGMIKNELTNFKTEFLTLFGDDIKKKDFDYDELGTLNPIIDDMHKNLKPKIAVVGFSGVGKTTIKNLIRQDEIPLQHIPTISGDIATIRIGKLEFRLFDFAGQDQFKYLWKGFIQGSNAVLIVTDSSPKNVDKSGFFIDLVNEEVPYARTAVLGNKQDLANAMKVEEIENILGLKTYPMIANQSENRNNMIRIIADILDMDIHSSPLLGNVLETKVPIIQENISTLGMNENLLDQSKNLDLKQEIPLDSIKNNYKEVLLALDLCNEANKEIKGLKINNILNNHFRTIGATITKLNNNEEFSYEDFLRNYYDYVNNNFMCKNSALKQFLESEFSRLKKSIDSDEIITTSDSKDDTSVIMNALICAYLSLVNPQKFPDFNALLQRCNIDKFNPNKVNEIHTYYLRILNKFNP